MIENLINEIKSFKDCRERLIEARMDYDQDRISDDELRRISYMERDAWEKVTDTLSRIK